MKQKISILLLLCVAILLPSIATAQEFNIFAKQKVVVADIRDMNDRHLSDGVKQCIRQGIIDACTKSSDYEVYEINIEDVKRQLTASEQKVSFPAICNAIGKRADYIIFTNVKLSSSEVGAQNITIYITSSLYRIATGSEMKTRFVEAAPTSLSILSATSKLVSGLLGINTSSQTQQLINSDNFVLSKVDLQDAGFRFAENGKAVSVNGTHGNKNIIVEGFANGNTNFDPTEYRGGKLNNNGRLCGLILFREGYTWSIAYCVDGEVAFPVLEAYQSNNIRMLCVQERRKSYGIRRYNVVTDRDDWTYFGETDRLFADEFVKIFGYTIKTSGFLKNMSKGIVDISLLSRNFNSYIANGNKIPSAAWEDD